MKGFYVLTDLDDLSFVAENKLDVAIPTKGPNAKACYGAMKEVCRDGHPYREGSLVSIGLSDFQIFYYNKPGFR